jgi:hypothetical protein
MTVEKFEVLVHRMERESKRSPGGYRLRVLSLALLPYVYVAAVVLLALALIAALVASVVLADRTHGGLLKLGAKVGWALGMLVFAIGRALWVTKEKPEGFVLEREAHPRLFEEIERVREDVGAPPAHVVMLDDRCNAAISQHSRLGILAGRSTTSSWGCRRSRRSRPRSSARCSPTSSVIWPEHTGAPAPGSTAAACAGARCSTPSRSRTTGRASSSARSFAGTRRCSKRRPS